MTQIVENHPLGDLFFHTVKIWKIGTFVYINHDEDTSYVILSTATYQNEGAPINTVLTLLQVNDDGDDMGTQPFQVNDDGVHIQGI